MDALHGKAREGFSREAQAYERGRPEYAPELADWLRRQLGLNDRAIALDLGAGTGKFSRLLATVAGETLAVEPVEAMRAQLQAACRACGRCRERRKRFRCRMRRWTP
ncbi:Uncharacterised protein [Chromobacterium violaceum]|uniref:GCM domain-containing protein n=1 Tax=Chromobacterium violaceum TaxID=536 RepID=A0A3S4JYD4_CHRVL|nr:Uncharacterised protein [Chromobacterium violaceum]